MSITYIVECGASKLKMAASCPLTFVSFMWHFFRGLLHFCQSNHNFRQAQNAAILLQKMLSRSIVMCHRFVECSQPINGLSNFPFGSGVLRMILCCQNWVTFNIFLALVTFRSWSATKQPVNSITQFPFHFVSVVEVPFVGGLGPRSHPPCAHESTFGDAHSQCA